MAYRTLQAGDNGSVIVGSRSVRSNSLSANLGWFSASSGDDRSGVRVSSRQRGVSQRCGRDRRGWCSYVWGGYGMIDGVRVVTRSVGPDCQSCWHCSRHRRHHSGRADGYEDAEEYLRINVALIMSCTEIIRFAGNSVGCSDVRKIVKIVLGYIKISYICLIIITIIIIINV